MRKRGSEENLVLGLWSLSKSKASKTAEKHQNLKKNKKFF